MGKGTIIGHLGLGQYTVEIDSDWHRPEEKVEYFLKLKTEINTDTIPPALAEVNAQASIVSGFQAQVSSLTNIWASDQTAWLTSVNELHEIDLALADTKLGPEERATLKAQQTAKQAEVAENEKAMDESYSNVMSKAAEGAEESIKLADLNLILEQAYDAYTAADKSQTAWENREQQGGPEQVSIWCADVSDGIEADAIPDGTEVGLWAADRLNGVYGILPAYPSGLVSQYSREEHGQFQQGKAADDNGWMVNLMLYPGATKWREKHGICKITAINPEYNTCSVIRVVTDAAQRILPANTGWDWRDISDTIYENIPIQYMNCNAMAFDEGDIVVAEFSSSGRPSKVIGFAESPKPCRGTGIETRHTAGSGTILIDDDGTKSKVGNQSAGTTMWVGEGLKFVWMQGEDRYLHCGSFSNWTAGLGFTGWTGPSNFLVNGVPTTAPNEVLCCCAHTVESTLYMYVLVQDRDDTTTDRIIYMLYRKPHVGGSWVLQGQSWNMHILRATRQPIWRINESGTRMTRIHWGNQDNRTPAESAAYITDYSYLMDVDVLAGTFAQNIQGDPITVQIRSDHAYEGPIAVDFDGDELLLVTYAYQRQTSTYFSGMTAADSWVDETWQIKVNGVVAFSGESHLIGGTGRTESISIRGWCAKNPTEYTIQRKYIDWVSTVGYTTTDTHEYTDEDGTHSILRRVDFQVSTGSNVGTSPDPGETFTVGGSITPDDFFVLFLGGVEYEGVNGNRFAMDDRKGYIKSNWTLIELDGIGNEVEFKDWSSNLITQDEADDLGVANIDLSDSVSVW